MVPGKGREWTETGAGNLSYWLITIGVINLRDDIEKCTKSQQFILQHDGIQRETPSKIKLVVGN